MFAEFLPGSPRRMLSSYHVEADDLGTRLDELKNRGLPGLFLTHFTSLALVLLVLVVFKSF